MLCGCRYDSFRSVLFSGEECLVGVWGSTDVPGDASQQQQGEFSLSWMLQGAKPLV